MTVRITCINKDSGNHENPHVAISQLGWINPDTNKTGKSTRIEMYNWIRNENGQAYVTGSYGNKAYLVTRVSAHGNPYVQTVADGTPTDNLLKLSECA